MSLEAYRRKRDFSRTPEPRGRSTRPPGRRYVVQKHAARRLHYDFRLEIEGVLASWAVPKGPSLDPSVKSLAVHVEDHPLEYGSFEGIIPRGQYGGGSVMLWDRGTWTPEEDPVAGLRRGKLVFELHGKKLKGRWALVRASGRAEDAGRDNWLLMKLADRYARPVGEYDVLEALPDSAATGRTMPQIAAAADRVWNSDASRGQTAARRAAAPRKAAGKAAPRVKRAPRVQASRIAGALRRRPPARFSPQLATLVKGPPEGERWLHEFKFDGYRMLARIGDGDVKLLTRRGNDWTERFPSIADAVAKLKLRETILDGEIVVVRPDGTTDFQALQNALRGNAVGALAYYVFDVPYLDGYDLTKTPQGDRKQVLETLLSTQPPNGPLRYSDHVVGHGAEVLRHACQHGLEGIVSKRADGPYEQRRSLRWLKIKCVKSQEFVIGGWTDPTGARSALGALLLGYYRAGKLVYCGRVGTGFDEPALAEVKRQLDRLPEDKTPFSNPPRGASARGVHWVRPELVCEVVYGSWTSDGMLRHCSFKGLREDKPPREVVREDA